MAEYTWPVTVIHKVWCSSCDRLAETGELAADFNGMRDHLANLAAQGWRVYVSRSRRHYCPDCAPRPGHRMRLVAGRESATAERST